MRIGKEYVSRQHACESHLTTSQAINAMANKTNKLSRTTDRYTNQTPRTPQFGSLPSKHSFLTSPTTKTDVFAMFPGGMDSQTNRHFLVGPIKLRYGEHRGPNRGFGFVHCWKAHRHHAMEGDAKAALFSFLASVFVRGASIVYEGGIGSAVDRVAVVRSKAGAVILEEKEDQNDTVFYSIVTAIPGKQNQQGTRIGTF